MSKQPAYLVRAKYAESSSEYTFAATEPFDAGTAVLAQTRADSLGIVKVVSCKPYEGEQFKFELRQIYGTTQDMRKFLDDWSAKAD